MIKTFYRVEVEVSEMVSNLDGYSMFSESYDKKRREACKNAVDRGSDFRCVNDNDFIWTEWAVFNDYIDAVRCETLLLEMSKGDF